MSASYSLKSGVILFSKPYVELMASERVGEEGSIGDAGDISSNGVGWAVIGVRGIMVWVCWNDEC